MDSESNRVDNAYCALKELVTQYDFAPASRLIILPGEHLRIDELSDYVKASATPVRQALERLWGEGLIESIHKRGFFAKVPDASELQDLYEFAGVVLEYNIRRALDPLAVIRFWRSPTNVEAGSSGAITAKCIKHHAMTIESVFEELTQLSTNEQMQRMIRNFNDRSRYVRCLRLLRNADPIDEVRECLELINMVRNQNVKGACATLRKHIHRTIVDLPSLIREARSRWAIAAAV